MATKLKLSDFLNSPLMNVANSTPSGVPFAPVTRSLPYDSGSYQSPVVAQPSTPVRVSSPVVPTRQTTAASVPVAGPNTPVPAPTPAGLDYSKYTDPVTGKIMSPQEYADFLARRVNGGSIPNYAGNSLTQGPQTVAQLTGTATDLNNQRNDIATGTTDPYNAGSQSGIAYSPTELAAIEKAYAGVYDPALKDVFAKLDLKQKEDAAALELKQRKELAADESKSKLEQMAQQHIYDIELKKTPTPGTGSGSGLGGDFSSYVEGQNPIVDSWVQRISRGEAKLSDITGVKNQALRDMVNMGLNTVKARNATSSGNLDTVNTINNLLINPDLNNISGFLGQTGVTSLFGQAKTAKTEYDQILGAIQLAKAGQIKGQGAVSDYERTVLRDASAAINRGQNDEEFRKSLVKLRGVLMTSAGLEAPVRVTSPNGETVVAAAGTEEINDLIAEGNIVQYTE